MKHFTPSKLSSSVRLGMYAGSLALGMAASGAAWAQEQEQEAENKADTGFELIEVTATRRAGSVQEVPLNITALNDDVMKSQNILELQDVARWVPGLTVQDQGGRSASPIIVRGLNTNSTGPDSDAGTVATYFGDIPLFVDVKLIDVERVEVLIGPQGTLYGAGTLGGAIRYIPKKAETDVTSFEVFGDVFNFSESDDIGSRAYGVFNVPIIEDVLAIRGSVQRLDDPGFIDYRFLVRESGVSLPDPDFSDPEAVQQNLRSENDVNGEETITARVNLRYTPTDWLDASLTYFVQDQEVEGRSQVHFGALSDQNPLSLNIGPYDSAYRYLEPRDKKDQLLSLEVSVDLGFAELVSASGWSRFEAVGQRDQTDLLIRLDYGYEEFPAFSAFTREQDDEEFFSQEIRLVSKSDSKFQWIAGFYYSYTDDFGDSREFTPGFDQFAVDNFGGVGLRPDSLEFFSTGTDLTIERALFGEVSYDVNDKLSFTLGARLFEYDLRSSSGNALPLLETVFNGAPPDSIDVTLTPTRASDNDSLFKFNANYQFSRDVLGYFTLSEGFRIGGSNGVAPCTPEDLSGQAQALCALPDEVLFAPDTTTNTEIGIKSTWFSNRFHLNVSWFNIEWEDAQVDSVTANGQLPITANAGGAESQGIEIAMRAIVSDSLSTYLTFSNAEAELTEDAPGLFGLTGDTLPNGDRETIDAFAGDRLSGAPRNQVAFGLDYQLEVWGGKLLDITYGLTYQSDLFTKVGLRDFGERISGYTLHNIAAKLSDDDWSVTFYVDNLFDKYAFTGARRDRGDLLDDAVFGNQGVNRPDIQRNYSHFILQPLKVGIRFDYRFEL